MYILNVRSSYKLMQEWPASSSSPSESARPFLRENQYHAPSLPPSLRGSVWTLCSLCCVLQADARPPRSTCHGRRSLWLTTGCPSPRPRSGTRPAEVRTERLPRFTSKPLSGFWFFSCVFSWTTFDLLISGGLLACACAWWSMVILTPFPTPQPPRSCVASWVISSSVHFWSVLTLLHHSLWWLFICGPVSGGNICFYFFFSYFCVPIITFSLWCGSWCWWWVFNLSVWFERLIVDQW